MKSLKIASIFILSLFVFTITSCDDEPLEGEFITDGGGSGVTCVQATQNLATASATYGTTPTDDVNYAVVCNAYAVALQNMIDACGDDSGAIQTLLEALGCPAISNDCTDAQTATTNAETAYNADNTNTTLCNAYKAALQNEIAQCGDADGSLQDSMDALDCDTTDLILPRQITQTYGDGSTIVSDFTFTGNRLTKVEYTIDFVGSSTEIEMEEFTYSGDLLVRIDESSTDSSGNIETAFSVLEYNASNQLITETYNTSTNTQVNTFVHNTNGTVTFNEDGGQIYVYTMENGNIISEDNTNGNQDYSYTYDAKNGISKNVYAKEVLALLGYTTFNNNPLSYTNTGGATFPDNENNTYTYNTDNYPVTSNTSENPGTADEETYTSMITYY
ncbi:hypothetical protein [Lacinutrix sp. MEBiC02595]